MAWFEEKYARVRAEQEAVQNLEKKLGRKLTLEEVEDLMSEMGSDFKHED